MLVKITTEVEIDVSGLSEEFIDIKGFAIDEAKRILKSEPEFLNFDYKVIEE